VIYDAADRAGKPAPNIKQVPPLAQARLAAEGFTASLAQITRIADEAEFKTRRRTPGKRIHH
jgi:hypothetical protein